MAHTYATSVTFSYMQVITEDNFKHNLADHVDATLNCIYGVNDNKTTVAPA